MIIRLKNLRVRTTVGVYDRERQRKRDVLISAELHFDGDKAAASDDLRDTVDYKALRDRIVQAVEGADCRLLEALAGKVLKIVLSEPRVTEATVRLDKPGALRGAESVSVTCSGRKDGR